MIKNEKQYRAAAQAIEQFDRTLRDRSASPPPDSGIHPTIWVAERDAILGELEQLRSEVQRYQALKAGTVRLHEIRSWDDVPQALIEGRIAANLTHKELSERLGVQEQQLQRYESTDYASASLTRLKEVAAALSLELSGVLTPSDDDLTVSRFWDRLSELGLNRSWLAARVLPEDMTEAVLSAKRKGKQATTAAIVRAADTVARVFNVSIQSLFGDRPVSLNPDLVPQTRYKKVRKADEKEMSTWSKAYTAYAYFIARRVLEATAHLPRRRLPTNPAEWRRQIRAVDQHGRLTLEAALQFFWNHGIPVVPLNDRGSFHGACWRTEDAREVIVLKQGSSSPDRWLGDLLHEGAHVVQEPGTGAFAIIEKFENPSATDARERAATEFAADVMLNGRAEELALAALQASDGNIPFLKRNVPYIAREASVPVGALAYYVAFYISRETEGRHNWWGTAQALQPKDDPWRVVRNSLLAHVELERLNATDRDVVVRALSKRPEDSVE